jgi:hypothetical protein
VTAEPARVISVMNLWAWRIVAGLKAVEERTWRPSWRGVLRIHASKESDLSAPADLWPPAGQLISSAIIGHVTLASVEGRPGAWRWMLTNPQQLTRPVTGVRGHPGLWLIDLPQGFLPAGTPPGFDRAGRVDMPDDSARGSYGARRGAALALASASGLRTGQMEV